MNEWMYEWHLSKSSFAKRDPTIKNAFLGCDILHDLWNTKKSIEPLMLCSHVRQVNKSNKPTWLRPTFQNGFIIYFLSNQWLKCSFWIIDCFCIMINVHLICHAKCLAYLLACVGFLESLKSRDSEFNLSKAKLTITIFCSLFYSTISYIPDWQALWEASESCRWKDCCD